MVPEGSSMAAASSALPSLSFHTLPVSFNITHSFVDKLNRSNFLSWKAQLLSVLAIHDLSHLIASTASPPPSHLDDNTPNPEHLLWKMMTCLSLAGFEPPAPPPINLCCFPTHPPSKHGPLLNTVSSGFEAPHQNAEGETLQHPQTSLTLNVGYLLQAKNTADELAATGRPVSDSELVDFVTDGLGLDYNHLLPSLAFQHQLTLKTSLTFFCTKIWHCLLRSVTSSYRAHWWSFSLYSWWSLNSLQMEQTSPPITPTTTSPSSHLAFHTSSRSLPDLRCRGPFSLDLPLAAQPRPTSLPIHMASHLSASLMRQITINASILELVTT